MYRAFSSLRDYISGTSNQSARRSDSGSMIRITRMSTPLPLDLDQTKLYPVAKGEIFNEKYRALRMLGHGTHSTVWLVRDIRTEQEFAMKVMVSWLSDNNKGPDELGVLRMLQSGPSSSPGKPHVCQLLDSFVHHGPATGKHTCLILEPLGLSVLDVYHSFPSSLPLILVQRIAKQVLQGLQYMHECGVIHTDIKGDNILLTGIGFAEDQTTKDIEIMDLFSITYKLTDFGSANTTSRQWAAVIQPLALRSPEVLIGAPWDTKTDIWNFGCLMYEFARGAILFDPAWQNEETGMDHTQTHLSQMVGLLGPFPQSFVAKGVAAKQYFDESGHLLRPSAYGITLEDLLSRAGHPAEELPQVVDFLLHALTIDPEERWSAAQLLAHPWMQDVL
ncbi:kinase-like protein [Fomitopsis serialis]|uniref:kinase-like protein n=1 Tax=Fomitopsis serialis TaxID=139415 RepID=UPI0020074E0D|nr:kinase-like protein [Neoantrodia serialis]KAH9917295.1 kinase-like protein [Neoantrodia serialis]